MSDFGHAFPLGGCVAGVVDRWAGNSGGVGRGAFSTRSDCLCRAALVVTVITFDEDLVS